jgi:N6-L-threonylcarbamoyladenine synthase
MSRAVDLFRGQHPDIQRPALVAAGGVAANGVVRSALRTIAGDHGFHFVAPPLALCGDNGAMIAWAGLERAALGFPSCALDVAPRARWPLDDVSAPVFGAGKKGAKA